MQNPRLKAVLQKALVCPDAVTVEDYIKAYTLIMDVMMYQDIQKKVYAGLEAQFRALFASMDAGAGLQGKELLAYYAQEATDMLKFSTLANAMLDGVNRSYVRREEAVELRVLTVLGLVMKTWFDVVWATRTDELKKTVAQQPESLPSEFLEFRRRVQETSQIPKCVQLV